MDAHTEQHVGASKRCQSYFNTFKCLVMALEMLRHNVNTIYLWREQQEIFHSAAAITIIVWTWVEYMMIIMVISGLLGNGLNSDFWFLLFQMLFHLSGKEIWAKHEQTE